MNIEEFINALRDTDEYIRYIYTKGSCYKFHVLLSKMYKGSVPYISENKDHIITRYRGKYYDINGEVKNIKGYRELNEEEIPMVKGWSFYHHNLIVLNECPNCDEPLTFKI